MRFQTLPPVHVLVRLAVAVALVAGLVGASFATAPPASARLTISELPAAEARLADLEGRLAKAETRLTTQKAWRELMALVVAEAEAGAERAAAVEIRQAVHERVQKFRRIRNRLTRNSTALAGEIAEVRTGLPTEEQWAALRHCEATGNYQAINPSGKYRGAYQFDQPTWESVGGTGDPAAASPEEQDLRALLLYQSRGHSPWPHCGRYLIS